MSLIYLDPLAVATAQGVANRTMLAQESTAWLAAYRYAYDKYTYGALDAKEYLEVLDEQLIESGWNGLIDIASLVEQSERSSLQMANQDSD